MDCKETYTLPLCLENDQYVLKPVIDKSVGERALSDISSASNSSSSRRRSKASGSQNGSLKNNSNTNAPSASSADTKTKNAASSKRKKMMKKSLFLCVPCEVKLGAGDFRAHILGKQHKKKAVPKMSRACSVTVTGFSPDTTEAVLFDYFSTFGSVRTVFIYGEQELCAVVEFVRKCSVRHATEYFAGHRLGNSNLTVAKGLPVENIQNVNSDGNPAVAQKVSSVVNSVLAKLKKEECQICGVEFNAGSCRLHYLSKQHTRKAYFKCRVSHCITVKRFHHDTTARALYDYFSRSGRVITLIIFREQELCAAIEYMQKCSVDHVANCLTPHMIGNCRLVVSAGLPFGACLPNMPAYLNDNSTHLQNFCSEEEEFVKKKKIVTAPLVKAIKSEANGSEKQKRKKEKISFNCDACSVFASSEVDRRNHYLGKAHIKKTIKKMREWSCITVEDCPVTITKEELYDFFNSYELVRTVDMRRLTEGLVVIEFESKCPLKDIDFGNALLIGKAPVILTRGRPVPAVATQSTVPHDKKVQQQEQKTVGSHNQSQTTGPLRRTLDSLIKNEFENAMKVLRTQESALKTVTENPEACSTNGPTPKAEIVSMSPPSAGIVSTSPAPSSGIKPEPVRKPFMCDACNVFVKQEDLRVHHLGKKHNENATKYLKVNCCISVKGFPKGSMADVLYDYFSQFGKVKVVVIPKKKMRGALVGFYSAKSARSVVKANGLLKFKSNELSIELGYPSLYGRGKQLESLPAYDDLMCMLQKCKTVECQISCLQSSLLLSSENMQARINMCNLITETLSQFFPHCVLHLFGSSVNSFGLKGSDVDILFEANRYQSNMVGQEEHVGTPEIKGPNVKIKSPNPSRVIDGHFDVQNLTALPKIAQLDFIKKVLRKKSCEFYTVVFVSSAACPIVKFISKRYGLCCDLSNGNRLSLCNTGLLQTFGKLDKRVIPLVTVLRYWAKKFNYICTTNFSSYAFTLMVIFFLQTREPQILPSVEYLRSRTDKKIEEAGLDCSFCSDVTKIEPSTNCETLENLLFEFFNYYGKFDYSKHVISPLTGCCELVELFRCGDPSSSQNFKVGAVCIQDPFLITRNVSSFVKEESLKRMAEHMRKIPREQYAFVQKQKSQTGSSETAIWGIPQLFEIMPKFLKVPKKAQGANPFTMTKIMLDEAIVNGTKKRYDIQCTQCVNLSEIVVHEVCRLVIDVMHILQFDTEIIFDERNHHEWVLNSKNISFSCTCAESHSTIDDVHNEKLNEDLPETSDSLSEDLSTSDEEKAEEDCLEVDGRSCSGDSVSEDSDAGQFSNEQGNDKTVNVDELDTQNSASTKVPMKFDLSNHKEFLSLWFTATHETWTCRKIYRKQCRDEINLFELERLASEKITKVKSKKLEKPVKLKCEFYDFYAGTPPIIYLKMTPPDQKRCWKPLTSFLKSYFPKMVQCSLST